MTDKEKLDAIRAEIYRLVDVRGYDRGMANDLFAFMDSLPNEPVSENLEEAEDVGVEILARCLALHTFARKDGVVWFERTTNRIIERMDEWRKDNAFVLAFASVANERQKGETK